MANDGCGCLFKMLSPMGFLQWAWKTTFLL